MLLSVILKQKDLVGAWVDTIVFLNAVQSKIAVGIDKQITNVNLIL